MFKTAIPLFVGLLLLPLHRAVAQPPPAQPPDRSGVFAVTDRGTIELTGYGERHRQEHAIDSFSFTPSALDQIPVVSSVRAFYVNMMGWVPKDLYLIVGRKRLATPRDEYHPLTGRAYSRGPVLFDVVTEELEPAKLEQAYRKLASKKRSGEDVRPFIVLELNNRSGLDARSYPIRVEIQLAPDKK